MNKNVKQKSSKKIISLVLVITICISVFGIFMYKPLCKEFGIPDFSDNGNIVYTPEADHLPIKFHVTIFCIDEYMHWVYKLNKDEQKEVLADIEKGNWTLLNEDIFCGIKDFDGFYGGGKILGKELLNHKCYVCVCDPYEDRIITNEDDYCYLYGYHSQWVIYLYDTETYKYYCLYATI